MANVTITKNQNIKDVDIAELKSKLSSFNDYIYEATSTVVDADKVYNRKLAKPMTSDNERFVLKVDINKTKASNLFIEYILADSLGTECISFDNEYTSAEDIRKDLDYVMAHIDDIK